MDLKVRIIITDELADDEVTASGMLDLASGEITRVEYDEHDAEAEGHPWEADDYQFTCGMLSHEGKDVEFKIEVNRVSGQRSVSANELLEIKVRAAKLFAGVSAKDLASGGAGKRHH